MSREPGSFLERWSRRKAAVRDGAPDPEPGPEAGAGEAEEVPAIDAGGSAPVDEDALTDAELAEHHGLPDPESMQAGDDVAVFMRAGVPARLRRLALRRLWRLNPEIVAHDGLTDYAEDYTDAATVVPGMKTLYQVGRGGAAYLEDLARQLTGPEDERGPEDVAGPEGAGVPDADPAEEIAAEPGGDIGALTEPPSQPAAAGTDGRSAETEAERVPPPRPVRRHMVFTGPSGDDRAG